jgi:hypothetical protein
LSNKEIARTSGVAEQTVKNQLATLYQKTGASSRLELAMFARSGKLDVDVRSDSLVLSDHCGRFELPVELESAWRANRAPFSLIFKAAF